MIITVTLNAAIDKSLSMAELPWPDAPHGRAAPMAGGKGVNIARTLQVLPARDRHRTGRASPNPHRRGS